MDDISSQRRWISVLFCLVFACILMCPHIIPVSRNAMISYADHRDKRKRESTQVLFHGSPRYKRIALTFDDGPDHNYTIQVLDILRNHQVPATFFIIGRQAKRNADVLQRIVKEGHVIGNHSYDHADFTKLTAKKIRKELKKTNQMIERITGKKPTLFRPPYGALNQNVEKLVSKAGYTIVYWNVDTKDWRGRSAKKILSVVKKDTQAGSIILFHSAGGHRHLQGMVAALPKIIHYLKQQGYTLVTIDRLFDISAYTEYTK